MQLTQSVQLIGFAYFQKCCVWLNHRNGLAEVRRLWAEEWRSHFFSHSDHKPDERVSFETYRKSGMSKDAIAPAAENQS